jgi:hypothetical protein
VRATSEFQLLLTRSALAQAGPPQLQRPRSCIVSGLRWTKGNCYLKGLSAGEDRSSRGSLIPLTLSLPLSRPLGFAQLCRGFPARSIRSIDEAGARNGPILTRCCAREHVKRPIFGAL